MAALEKIRNKAAFLTIVIGVALLAFIMGDFLNSGRSFFSDGNTIAKVGGEKINAQEFQKRYEQVNSELQKNGQSQQQDPAVVQAQVLNQMISEQLIKDELEEVGIFVTDNELSEVMMGKNAAPNVVQFAQQCGVESPAQLYDLLFNPTKYGQTEQSVAEIKAEWLKLEDQMSQMLAGQKLANLVQGSLQANDLDKKEMFEENATTCYINYVKQDYSTLKDSEFPVSDAELNAAYDKEKGMFKIDEEVRRAHLITVDVTPSNTDLAAAKKMIDETMANLTSKPGVDGIRNNSELTINENTVRLSDIRDNEMKTFVQGASVGAVSAPKFVQNVYTIVKVNGSKVETDSVNLNVVMVQGDKKLQTNVLAQLNGGKTLAEVMKANSKTVQGQEDQWQVLMSAPDSIKTKVLNAGAEYFALQSSDQGAYIVKVNKKAAPKAMYDLAVVTYQVYPSTETVNGLRDKLQNYINKNNTTDLFTKNAVAAGFNAYETEVSTSSPQINNIPYTRKAIQWLFEAEKGSVSPIFDKENKNVMVVVALDDVYKPEYLPVNDPAVKNYLTAKVRNSKKGDKLVKDLTGKAKDVAGYASLMKAKVDTAQVTFGQPFIPGIGGGESELIAKVSVAKQGAFQGPVKGNNAVYAYVVTKQDRTQRKPGPEVERQFAQTRGAYAVMQHAIDILRQNANVQNKMIHFF